MISIRRVLARLGLYTEFISDVPGVQDALERLQPTAITDPLIRIGSSNDGGYLMPDVIEGIKAVFSPGVADNSSFEKFFAEMGIPVFLADESVTGPLVQHINFHFTKKFIGRSALGHLPLLTWWQQSGAPDGDLLLQMDIEGSEFETIIQTSDEMLCRFRVMIFELHTMERVFNESGRLLFNLFMDKVCQNHTLVHTHANNVSSPWVGAGISLPVGVELTFVRNDFLTPSINQFGNVILPHSLDQDCVPSKKPTHIRFAK